MASLKEWWEFFSDSDVKWTFGAMMVVLWIITMIWMAAINMYTAPDYTYTEPPNAQAGPE